MTDYEIAKESGISYPTTKKYVNKLINEGMIIHEQSKKSKV